MGVLIILVFVALMIGVSLYQRSAATKAWSEASAVLGMNQVPGTLSKSAWIGGQMRGVHVDVRVVHKGSGKNRSTFTRYEVTHPATGPDVRLTRQGTFSFLRRMVGGRDVAIGDPQFDDSVMIDAPDPTAVAEFLTPARRVAVLTIFQIWAGAEISNRSIAAETSGMERNVNKLVGSVNRLVDTALVMSAPTVVDHALELQQQGQLADGVEELHALNDAEPNSFTQLLEAEGLMALGERQRASEMFEQVEIALPGDPEVAGWREVARRPPPMPVVEPPAPTPRMVEPPNPTPSVVEPPVPVSPTIEDIPAASPIDPSEADPAGRPAAGPPIPVAMTGPSAEAIDLSQQAVIDDLLGSNRMGFEIEDRFETAYLGHEVTWTGELENLRDFRTDSDFGTEPGTKTTVLIGNLGNSRLVSNQIHAIVQLPPDLDLARDQEITFTGSLLRIDRYMRKIYVGDASLSS